MKTITVTDEMYDSLMNISIEMNSQDHRFTRMPYMFQVMDETREVCIEGAGDKVWIDDEGNEIGCEDDLVSYVEEITDEPHDIHKAIEFAEEHGYIRVNLQDGKRYQNFFFTEKACKDHIERNEYHYNNPKDYLNAAFRNPELEVVQKFLCELSGGKIHV